MPKIKTKLKANRPRVKNWIRREKRLAIYLRDGLACIYCGSGVKDGVKLTLDHVKTWKSGGSNSEKNLVTCCYSCNSIRGAKSLEEFLNYGNFERAAEVLAAIKINTKKKLDIAKAKELIASRGEWINIFNNN